MNRRVTCRVVTVQGSTLGKDVLDEDREARAGPFELQGPHGRRGPTVGPLERESWWCRLGRRLIQPRLKVYIGPVLVNVRKTRFRSVSRNL